jgi:hypothetical protein
MSHYLYMLPHASAMFMYYIGKVMVDLLQLVSQFLVFRLFSRIFNIFTLHRLTHLHIVYFYISIIWRYALQIQDNFFQHSIMLVAPWYCDGCGRQNGVTRYQCQHCRGFNTYDLCDQCIARANIIHPNHSFQLVQAAGNTIPVSNWSSPFFG